MRILPGRNGRRGPQVEDFSDPKDVAGIIGCPLKEVDLKGGDCQAQALLFFFF